MIFKMKNSGPAVAFVILLALSAGCGTLMNGTQHYLAITSTPPGAKVTVDNREFFDTPITAVLDKNESHTVQIELEGYLPFQMKISRKLDGWAILGDLFLLYVPGLVVDLITGGIYTLSPEHVIARLKEEDLGLIDQRELFYISVVLEPAPGMERIASLTKRTHFTK